MKIKEWLNDPEPSALPRYVEAFDILNIISCIAVVAMHVNVAFWQFSHERYWVTSNFISAVCYFAVPVFIMITGATLIDYRERYSTREFFKKRVLKTFVPFLIWSAVAIIYRVLRDGPQFLSGGVIDTVFNARANANYWFFIMLFAVYLSIPVLSAIDTKKRKKIFTYAAVLAVVTNSVLPLACKLLNISMNNDIKLPVAAGYLMFAIIGYCITRYRVGRPARLVIYGFGALGFCLIFFGTVYSSFKAGSIVNTFSEYLNIPCVMLSVAVFVWFFYNRHLPKSQKLIKLIRKVSGASFGVYLMHWFVVDVTLQLFSIDTKTWQWRVLGTAAIYIVCLFITLVIKKIPVIKNIVP